MKMKLNSTIGLMAVLSVMSCSAQKETKRIPDSVSGIYPRPAYYNNEGECGTGAVVPEIPCGRRCRGCGRSRVLRFFSKDTEAASERPMAAVRGVRVPKNR